MLGGLNNPYRKLEKELGYRFKRRDLLEEALTHRSYRYENAAIEWDNQRLEFLGDAALGMVAAAHLYEVFPEQAEGRLTAARSKVTSGKALAAIAEELGLGEVLRVGRGEARSGGRTRASNLADALESVIGAAYLDGGERAVRRIFMRVFVKHVSPLHAADAEHNPKGRLQEMVQGSQKCSPTYRVVRQAGPSHAREFEVEVLVGGEVLACGLGPSKRAAETEAARRALRATEELEGETHLVRPDPDER